MEANARGITAQRRPHLELQIALAHDDDAAQAQRLHGANLSATNKGQSACDASRSPKQRTQCSSIAAWLVPGVKSE